MTIGTLSMLRRVEWALDDVLDTRQESSLATVPIDWTHSMCCEPVIWLRTSFKDTQDTAFMTIYSAPTELVAASTLQARILGTGTFVFSLEVSSMISRERTLGLSLLPYCNVATSELTVKRGGPAS